MKKIGFTGTRNGMSVEQKETLKKIIREKAPDSIEAHHGLCKGADAEFHDLVVSLYKKDQRQIIGHPPKDEKHVENRECDKTEPAKEYLQRNKDIVEQTSMLVACPSGKENRRSGTWATVRYAKRSGKPVVIVEKSGTWYLELPSPKAKASVDPKWESELIHKEVVSVSRESQDHISSKELNLTPDAKREIVKKISEFFAGGKTEISMRKIMDELQYYEAGQIRDFRPSQNFLKEHGFELIARRCFYSNPECNIIRFFVKRFEQTK